MCERQLSLHVIPPDGVKQKANSHEFIDERIFGTRVSVTFG